MLKEVLPAETLNKAFGPEACKDEKLVEIVKYLSGLIHKQTEEKKTDEAGSKEAKSADPVDKDKAKQRMKELAAKKRKALMDKMKKKQTNFMAPSQLKPAAAA